MKSRPPMRSWSWNELLRLPIISASGEVIKDLSLSFPPWTGVSRLGPQNLSRALDQNSLLATEASTELLQIPFLLPVQACLFHRRLC